MRGQVLLFLLGVAVGWIHYGLCNLLLQKYCNKRDQREFDFSKKPGRLLNLLLPIAEPVARYPRKSWDVVQQIANDERRLRSQTEAMDLAAIRLVPPGIEAIEYAESLRREHEIYRRARLRSPAKKAEQPPLPKLSI